MGDGGRSYLRACCISATFLFMNEYIHFTETFARRAGEIIMKAHILMTKEFM